ncbi:MAG: sugar phosphate nucleotidyltransferase [Promethearchaeota archaeon]
MSRHKNEFKEKVTSVILCAGEGTRAKSIAKNIPKPLVKVESLKNQSILSLLIYNLVNLNLVPIVVITGHLGEKIADFINTPQIRDQYDEDHVMIHSSGEIYKSGPLFAFLSITNNTQIFKNDKIFMVFPGDTVFDYDLLEEILNILLENYSRRIDNPIMFYRKIRAEKLKKVIKKYNPNYQKSISHLKIEEKNVKPFVKEISQDNLSTISNNQVISQVMPVFVFTTDHVNSIKDFTKAGKFRTIREVVNLMIEEGQKFIALSVTSDQNFYDIDTQVDLEILNEIKKGGQ